MRLVHLLAIVLPRAILTSFVRAVSILRVSLLDFFSVWLSLGNSCVFCDPKGFLWVPKGVADRQKPIKSSLLVQPGPWNKLNEIRSYPAMGTFCVLISPSSISAASLSRVSNTGVLII